MVDDDEDLLCLVSLVLKSAGYAVETAGDGAAALDRIRTIRPDLVVLDLMMPILDGWGVLRELRGGEGPPVVVLSAAADPFRAMREGAAACLAKPFRVEVLVETCSRVLGLRA